MGNYSSLIDIDPKKTSISLSNSSQNFTPFCGSTLSQETLRNNEKSEIVLTSTYIYPRGTYTDESVRHYTPEEQLLLSFTRRNNIPGLRYLIIKGVNINILDEDRTSPLHIACSFSNVQMIEEIINQGGMINIPDIVGWTPLHIGCYYCRPDVILLLLKKGAKYQTKNRDKKTPRMLIDKEKGKFCFEIIDNFIQHDLKQIEKCIEEINQKNVVYEDIMEKYLTYQQLKGETLGANGEELTAQKSKKAGTDKKEKKSINEIENYAIKLDEEFGGKHSEYFSKILNDESEEEIPNENPNVDAQISRKSQGYFCNSNAATIKHINDIMSKYRYIPKKHKFYLSYEIKDGKIRFKNQNGVGPNEMEEQEHLIHNPNSFPLMTSISNLNHKEERDSSGAKSDIYSQYSSDTSSSEENLCNSSESLPFVELKIKNENDEDTLDNEDEILLHFVSSFDNFKEKIKIFPKTSTLPKKFEFYSNYFIFNRDVYEDILTFLFSLDYNFALKFLILISGIENSLNSLIAYVASNIFSKDLRTRVLTKNHLFEKIIDIYFSTFNYAGAFTKCLSNSFSFFSLSGNNLELLDDLSKVFAHYFYASRNVKEEYNINSENALYFLTFSTVISSFESEFTNDKEKIICDFIIMTKNLNEGSNYDSGIIKEVLEYVFNGKNLFSGGASRGVPKRKLINSAIIVNNTFTSYFAYYEKGLFVFYETKNCEVISKACYVKMYKNLTVKNNMITVEKVNEILPTLAENREGECELVEYDKVSIVLEDISIIKGDLI